MLTLKKSMLLLFFLGMVSLSLANSKRADEEGEDKRADEEGEDKRADEEGEDKRADEEGEEKRKRFLGGILNTITGLLG
uniref:Kassorin-S n=1 Tax=Kassina senegalensis TaxID=8415 RepID=KASSO_KASSE|nr:RecName: Full=Kassorin-S; AltName: Full=PreproKassorin-S; Flags: Precursor [Kassina senegalensis]CBL43005.1 Kassorin S precursor [Kassina senegalensis]